MLGSSFRPLRGAFEAPAPNRGSSAASALGTLAVGALAVGALAVDALAVGALAVGALAVGALAFGAAALVFCFLACVTAMINVRTHVSPPFCRSVSIGRGKTRERVPWDMLLRLVPWPGVDGAVSPISSLARSSSLFLPWWRRSPASSRTRSLPSCAPCVAMDLVSGRDESSSARLPFWLVGAARRGPVAGGVTKPVSTCVKASRSSAWREA
jgi:hypothetical protein